jgi:hypothetical protein
LNRLILDLAGFSGMENENMTRGHGWRFLGLGRRIERGIGVARLIEAAMVWEPVELLLEPVAELRTARHDLSPTSISSSRRCRACSVAPARTRESALAGFQLAAIQELVAHSSGGNPDGLEQIRQQAASLFDPLRRVWPREEATHLAPLNAAGS